VCRDRDFVCGHCDIRQHDAEQLCTPDVMRLCNEFIPNPAPIVRCLKAKRRQLSPGCHAALSGGGKGKSSKRKRVAKRR
jgi:hypothetical protein